MKLFVLDTDTLTLFLQGHENVCRRAVQLKSDQLAVTIINVEESLTGWYTQIRHARRDDQLLRAYEWMSQSLEVLRDVQILGFDANAIATYHQLHKKYRRIGTNDLRIAAIVLSGAATLVTRNLKDFGQIAGLAIEDWSQPMQPNPSSSQE